MLTARLGFPVILNDGAVTAVWIATQPVENREGSIFWGDDALNPHRPFTNTDLCDASKVVALTSDLFFRCDSAAVRRTSDGTIDLGGRSFGLALALAQHFALPQASSADVSVLLTGMIDAFSGEPRALRDASSLKKKIQYAQERGWALLVMPPDYEPPRDIHFVPLASTLDSIAQRIKTERLGHVLALPVERGRYWESSNTEWWAALGRALNLVPARSSLGARSASSVASGQIAAPHDSTASLFMAALPTHSEYLERLIQRDAAFFSRSLFEIGSSTIAEAQHVFHKRNERIAHRNILLAGPTASGKTSVTEALMVNAALEGASRVLYIAPTRSLANERYEEIRSRYAFQDSPLGDSEIVLSTGEESQNDWRLTDGRFRIAVLVNEKANLFLRPSKRLLDVVGLVVMDELHMLADPMRGGVLDLMIAKIRHENVARSLAAYGSPALRLAVVTTETRLLDQVQAFFDTPATVAPVVIKTTKRPLPVRHVAHAYGYSMWRRDPIEIVEFRDERDRILDPDMLRDVGSSLRTEFRELEAQSQTRSQQTPGDNGRSGLSHIIEHYASNQHSFRTVLVAHPSIDGVRNLAQRLADARGEAGVEFRVPTELGDLLRAAPASVGSILAPLAERGIYLHHSELRRELREWLEQHFRRAAAAQDHPFVIFATETLFYGVNLTVDCVVLTSPHWTREILGESAGEISSVPLTTTAFHNVLGRAGRPGRERPGVMPTAVVCFPASVYCTGRDEVDQALQRYYSDTPVNPDVPQVYSSLFSWRDVIEQEKKRSLAEISFPTFRAVMDALRFMAPAEAATSTPRVLDLLRQTAFGASASGTPLQDWDGIVAKTLSFAATCGLADATPPDIYRIRAEAEALIDTGTKWQSVAPMQKWLETLQSIEPDLILPVELMVPAFVCSQELWVPGRTFCWESTQAGSPNAQVRESNAQLTKALLTQELAHLKLDPVTCDRIEAALHNLLTEVAGYLPLKVAEYRQSVFYRLTCGLLRWVRGADEDSIMELSLRSIPEDETERLQKLAKSGRTFREQYRDRASWLAMMCVRFFEKKKMLRREHRRELPALAQRLRLGVPARGIPLISEARRTIQRQQVVELLRKGVDPLEIVRSRVPTEVLRGAVPGGADPIEIVDSVYRFYANETQKLAAELRHPDLETQWPTVIDACNRVMSNRSAGTSVAAVSTSSMHEIRSALVELAEVGRAGVVVVADKIRVREGGAEVVLSLTGFSDSTEQEKSIVVRVPWPQQSDSAAIEVTAVGGSVLVYLLAREFIRVGDLETWVSTTGGGFKPIREFIEEFVEELYVPTLPPEVLEALLGFNEPGA